MSIESDLDTYWPLLKREIQSRFPMFPSSIRQDAGAVAFWPEDQPVEEFLAFAEAHEAGPVYAGVTHFTRDDLEVLAENLRETEGEELSAESQGFLAKAETHVDSISHIEVDFVLGTVVHRWDAQATWFVSLMMDADELMQEKQLVAMAEQATQVETWARTLANDPQFQRTATHMTRILAARRLVPELERAWEDQERHQRGVVVSTVQRAQEIYRDEVKPEQERQMAAEAHDLLAEGLHKYEVAARLGIGTDKLVFSQSTRSFTPATKATDTLD